jgi:hypothetical protein
MTSYLEQETRELARKNQTRLLPGTTTIVQDMEYIRQLRVLVLGVMPLPHHQYQDYLDLLDTGPGQGHRLFPFLANEATREQMMWFLKQEAAGEAGFDDLVALAQIKMPTRAKLELARNYWDEMGNGREWAIHGRLLENVVKHFGITPSIEETVTESLRLQNLMMGLACNRYYAWYAIGALGVIEMTAPGRVGMVNEGLARLGVPCDIREYFALHSVLDVKHSREWNKEVIEPEWETHGQAIYEGAYLRLWAGNTCYERYWNYLQAPGG